jgi:hypothetical protein
MTVTLTGSTLSGCTISPSIVTAGTVLILDPGQTVSYPGTGATWYDLSGQNNNGTLVNSPAYSSSVGGGSLQFNGTNTYVTTPLNGVSDGTITAWHYPTASPNTNPYNGIIDCDNPAQYGTGFGITNSTYNTILDNQFWNPSVSATLNQWQYVAMTFNATTAKFYLNGVLKTTLSYTRGTLVPTTYKIGVNYANGLYYTGYIGAIYVYNTALSDSDVTQNYNALRGRYGL